MKRKKLLSITFAAILVFSCALNVYAQDLFVFGRGRQDISVQGANGWFYMYSTAHNKGDNFPVDTLKECIIGQTGWQAWGAPSSWVPDEPIFKSEERMSLWFRIHPDGMVRAGGMMTAALMWRAPMDGKFNLQGIFSGGLADEAVRWDYQGSDGVTFSIYQGTTRLVSRNSGAEKIEESFNFTVDLKKNESLFFICDPNLSDWDDSFWEIDIVTVEEPIVVPPPPTEPIKEEPKPAEEPTPVEEPKPVEEPVKEEPATAEQPAAEVPAPDEEPVKEEPAVVEEPAEVEEAPDELPVKEEPILNEEPAEAVDLTAEAGEVGSNFLIPIIAGALVVTAGLAYFLLKRFKMKKAG